MKKSLFVTALLFLTFFLFAGEFRIVATSDLHGDLRNFSALAPVIRRAQADLIMDAGDLTGANLLAELDGGKTMIKALNKLNYRFRVPGNHDFEQSFFSFTSQHCSFDGVTLGADWEWGETKGELCRVVRKGDFKIGIIGLTEPNVARRHLPGADSPRSRNWEIVMADALRKLNEEKVHCIVLIWHWGVDNPRQGARQIVRLFPQIHLVIGGHSHKEVAGVRQRQTYFVQPGSHGSSAVLTKVFYNDKTFQVERIESALLRGEPGKTAPDIDALSNSAFQQYRKEIFRKVCRKGDLSLRNFPRLGAEALRRAGNTQGAVFTSFIPDPGSAQGTLYKDLFRLLPYRNTLCTVELTRQELRELLEDLHRNSRKFKRTVGVAGFQWSPGNGRRKGVLKAPEKISVTVSNYVMTSSPVLKRMLHDTGRWQQFDLTERGVVCRYLEEQLRKKR